MKRFILIGAAGLIMAAVLIAGAPTNNGVANALIATQTIDSQITATWEFVDSMIVAQDDSCVSVYSIKGSAVLDPGNFLYIGFLIGGGDPNGTPSDTFKIEWPQQRTVAAKAFDFGFHIVDSHLTANDSTDTIYIMAAVKGGSKYEEVIVTNIQVAGSVIPKNL